VARVYTYVRQGIPLHIQIDTYEVDDLHCRRIHRAVCKIKVFCEKVSAVILSHHTIAILCCVAVLT